MYKIYPTSLIGSSSPSMFTDYVYIVLIYYTSWKFKYKRHIHWSNLFLSKCIRYFNYTSSEVMSKARMLYTRSTRLKKKSLVFMKRLLCREKCNIRIGPLEI